jgi:hypothetical protein
MPILRRLMLTTLSAAALLASATPTLAQTPAPKPAATPAPKEQGLGIFLQGGYVYQTIYTGGASFDSKPQGFIAGVGFGGNKSGWLGVGVDINYVWTNNSNADQKTQYLDIPVYARINIGGHQTKNAFTFYVPAGWFFDVNLSNQNNGIDVKDAFNGFGTGPLVGAGFEVARIGVEGRAQWGILNMLSDGSIFSNGTNAKQFTFILLFKVRLN